MEPKETERLNPDGTESLTLDVPIPNTHPKFFILLKLFIVLCLSLAIKRILTTPPPTTTKES